MMWGTSAQRFSHHYDSAAQVIGPHGDWMVIGMFVIPLLLFGALIWLVLRNTGHLSSQATTGHAVAPQGIAPSQSDSAIAIVRDRFARGEIDRDEYERLVTALRY